MKIRLNKRTIDDAVYEGPGGCYLWDAQMPSFGVRIYPSGNKSFVVTYWSRGRRRFYTLGRFGRLTLHQAREAALEDFLQVRRGEDPSVDRRAANHSPTVIDLADRHIDDHAKINNKTRNAKRARQLWDRCVVPKLGKRKVTDIGRHDIAKLMTSMAATPSMANKTLTLLSKAFNLAEVWGWRPEGTNPCRHIQRFKEEGRERYLSELELKRLGEVLTRRTRDTESARGAIPRLFSGRWRFGHHTFYIAVSRVLISTHSLSIKNRPVSRASAGDDDPYQNRGSAPEYGGFRVPSTVSHYSGWTCSPSGDEPGRRTSTNSIMPRSS